jgi:hypothetical protein
LLLNFFFSNFTVVFNLLLKSSAPPSLSTLACQSVSAACGA